MKKYLTQVKKVFIVLLVPFIFCNCSSTTARHAIYIRASQVGYLPNDLKTAIVFSEYPLPDKNFYIKNGNDSRTVFEGVISDTIKSYDKFKYCYTLDFSGVTTPGNYRIDIDGNLSYPFKIGNDIFNNVVDSLMLFFKEQRCGPTNPILHAPCHLSDVVRLIGDNNHKGPVDVTGGWHDAGDYIKFLSTTAYTTYMFIFSYEFDKTKFSFDDDKDGVPDVLEEAKIGLDWMLRCNYSKYKLITQVQDLKDHEVGWRMPENDTLRYDRPGYVGIGKNQIGLYAAVMAMASRVWSERFQKYDFAKQCLDAAENLYSIRDKVPNIDSSGSGFYIDNTYLGKLALGAVELYLATKENHYLEDAERYADSAGSDYWWSWGNINSLADFRLAQIEPRFADYILSNLISFNDEKDKTTFNHGIPYTWGTTNSLLGAALQEILYNSLTGSTRYDSLAIDQRDYVLGRNPWGLSFIYNTGSEFPHHFHSQVAYFHGGYLPGALSAGPAPESVLNDFKINRKNFQYNLFNTDSVKYYDDRQDYITNEPTITGNATALFVFGFYSNRAR